jgi:hypothetical protein
VIFAGHFLYLTEEALGRAILGKSLHHSPLMIRRVPRSVRGAALHPVLMFTALQEISLPDTSREERADLDVGSTSLLTSLVVLLLVVVA